MRIIDLQIYNFLMVLVYNLQPFQTKKPIYNLQEIKENNCRFYNRYWAKSTIYKKPAPLLADIECFLIQILGVLKKI